jgi:uncharacterized phage infection (PIP) family protein YhgE
MRHHLSLVKALLLPLLLTLVVLCACGQNSAPGNSSLSAKAKSAACQSLATVNQSLTSLANVGDNTTVGTVKAAQQKIASALNKLDTVLPNSNGPVLTQAQAANDQLGQTLQDYPDSATIGDTSVKLQGVKTKATSVQEKATQLSSSLKC